MFPNDLDTSHDSFELNENKFDDEPICDSMMVPQLSLTLFFVQLRKTIWLLSSSGSESDSENVYSKPKSSRIRQFNNFSEVLGLPDTGAVYGSSI